MFLVSDSADRREERIRGFIEDDPGIAALLAAAHFEWTVRRAIIALAHEPNADVRARLRRCHGLRAFKDAWREFVAPRRGSRLAAVVRDGGALKEGYELRNRLIHGVQACTSEYAIPRVQALLAAAADIRQFAQEQGIDLHDRLPVRRRPRGAGRAPAKEDQIQDEHWYTLSQMAKATGLDLIDLQRLVDEYPDEIPSKVHPQGSRQYFPGSARQVFLDLYKRCGGLIGRRNLG